MSLAQILAMRFELAHAAKNCPEPIKRARLLMKMAALDAQIKAAPPLGWRQDRKAA